MTPVKGSFAIDAAEVRNPFLGWQWLSNEPTPLTVRAVMKERISMWVLLPNDQLVRVRAKR